MASRASGETAVTSMESGDSTFMGGLAARKNWTRTLLWLVVVAVVACILIVLVMLAPWSSSPLPPGPGPSHDDQTSMTRLLNEQIKEGKSPYTGGKGILVRTPDNLTGSDKVVVPATFWVNDIKVPSQLYPSGNPWCPHGARDGYQSLDWMPPCSSSDNSTWDSATVSAVVGVDGMRKLIRDFDSIQNADWGWGVFYATDANAVGGRCRYINGTGWDCPGYWVKSDGSWRQDPNMKGAGYYKWGNPTDPASLGGGGAGCHFDVDKGEIDQVDATDTHQQDLVQNSHCECNYNFNQNWKTWVANWIDNNKQKKSFEWRSWLGKQGGKAPSWAVDSAICWTNNPRDMIAMQNAIYQARHLWNNEMTPLPGPLGDAAPRRYWGWNEVPVTRTVVDDPKNWDAVMIKLPATICGRHKVDSLACLSKPAQQKLEEDLRAMVTKGNLMVGRDFITTRPGSYMVVVREFDEAGKDEYTRQFFCERWSSPSGRFQLQFTVEQNSSNSTGVCFLDHGNATVIL